MLLTALAVGQTRKEAEQSLGPWDSLLSYVPDGHGNLGKFLSCSYFPSPASSTHGSEIVPKTNDPLPAPARVRQSTDRLMETCCDFESEKQTTVARR